MWLQSLIWHQLNHINCTWHWAPQSDLLSGLLPSQHLTWDLTYQYTFPSESLEHLGLVRRYHCSKIVQPLDRAYRRYYCFNQRYFFTQVFSRSMVREDLYIARQSISNLWITISTDHISLTRRPCCSCWTRLQYFSGLHALVLYELREAIFRKKPIYLLIQVCFWPIQLCPIRVKSLVASSMCTQFYVSWTARFRLGPERTFLSGNFACVIIRVPYAIGLHACSRYWVSTG